MKKTPIKTRAVERGFTLTELLVVITIIVVLAALSFMGVRGMRATADKVNSTRNLSQLQIANASYAADHNGRFVPVRANDDAGNPTRWFQDDAFLGHLIGAMYDGSGMQIQTIPLEMLDPKVVRARKHEYNRIFASYGMNDNTLQLGGTPNLISSHNMNRMSDPARTMAFATAIDFRVTYNSRFNWKLENQTDTRQAPGSVGAIAYRHKNKAMIVYFDGHVGEISQPEMREIDSTKRGKNGAFWNPEGK